MIRQRPDNNYFRKAEYENAKQEVKKTRRGLFIVCAFVAAGVHNAALRAKLLSVQKRNADLAKRSWNLAEERNTENE